ncbi:hypothetical protein FQA39_LY03298 [Lamprigera yunnana]|nr:hypothetical protein FQA39_LY03298 [Lamprigera yunnana]
MSKRIELDLSKESDREIVLKWLRESNEEFIEREIFSDVSELEDNLEVESSAESTIECESSGNESSGDDTNKDKDAAPPLKAKDGTKWSNIPSKPHRRSIQNIVSTIKRFFDPCNCTGTILLFC